VNAPELLSTLRARGVVARREGDALKLDAPKGAVADLLSELQRFKPVLLELLETEQTEGERARQMAHLLAHHSRVRLARLVERLGEDGACVTINATARQLKREKPDFWRHLSQSDRHDLAVCVALLSGKARP